MKKSGQNKIESGTRKDQEISITTKFGSGKQNRLGMGDPRDMKINGHQEHEILDLLVVSGGATDISTGYGPSAVRHGGMGRHGRGAVVTIRRQGRGRENVRQYRDKEEREHVLYTFVPIGA
jgi:hypothetical protein